MCRERARSRSPITLRQAHRRDRDWRTRSRSRSPRARQSNVLASSIRASTSVVGRIKSEDEIEDLNPETEGSQKRRIGWQTTQESIGGYGVTLPVPVEEMPRFENDTRLETRSDGSSAVGQTNWIASEDRPIYHHNRAVPVGTTYNQFKRVSNSKRAERGIPLVYFSRHNSKQSFYSQAEADAYDMAWEVGAQNSYSTYIAGYMSGLSAVAPPDAAMGVSILSDRIPALISEAYTFRVQGLARLNNQLREKTQRDEALDQRARETNEDAESQIKAENQAERDDPMESVEQGRDDHMQDIKQEE